MRDVPYWGTYEGRIIESIVEGARTWEEIYKVSRLNRKQVNMGLKTLLLRGEVTKEFDGEITTYRVNYDLYRAYKDIRESTPIERQMMQDSAEWMKPWLKANNVKDHEPLFLSTLLSNFIQTSIRRARKELLIISPFFDHNDIMRDIHDVAKGSVKVKFITRRQEGKNWNYLKSLSKIAEIFVSPKIHSKLFVVDEEIGIVCSMNLLSDAISGKSSETGLVTRDEQVIQEIKRYFQDRSTEQGVRKL